MTETALTIEWYLSRIREELKPKLEDNAFIGNVSFNFNIKHGGIANVNIGGERSVRKP